ncbi:CAP domain-containing protein [Candidatus Saccharibacteria bacterium]|nr:CAP domain-containing protein [Candidatus Saccharibacteria bacterium]
MAAAAAAKMIRQTRMTILLSVNAVAILIAGVLVASAMGFAGSGDLDVVSEYSDEIDGSVEEVDLGEGESAFVQGNVTVTDENGNTVTVKPAAPNSTTDAGETTNSNGQATGGNVPAGELWNETSMTIYQSADKDICIDDSLPGYSRMYWQSSNKNVIKSFYKEARSSLGYNSSKCRYPVIVGTGKTTITAGTYDGSRRDKIEITVVAVPIDQWKDEVLKLVNNERAKNGLPGLAWGSSTASASETRARELVSKYAHTRPDGSEWKTVLNIPEGNYAGENIAAGAGVPSPSTVVNAWMNSASHRANILNSNFRYMSVGIVFDINSANKIYWAQIFSSY